MRRIIAILGVLVLGVAGCRHVGGKCDCGVTPGEAALYAPMQGYQTNPTTTNGREVIGAPKTMPVK